MAIEVNVLNRVPVREQEAEVRAKNFEEVCYGYNEEEAMAEASRCIGCKNAPCMGGCPVSINIPGFIAQVKEGNFAEAFKIISESSALPAVCGRVCPQETQCEQKCIRGIKGDAVSIGKLERFVADWARENGIKPEPAKEKNGHKVAVIGSGPSGVTAAGDLAKMGYDVTIFEALHEPGGVLVYGIPEFRLPKEKVVKKEIENIKSLGVKIETNVVVGKSVTIDSLINEEGFDAVFIGSGAGLPKFMGIPGENANGVFSANEYLTRSNLMKAFDENSNTPIMRGKKVAVVGGGNVAMDAARTALRLGAETHIVYRRSEEELPARVEEVHHAKEEGIIFDLLTNPTEILEDENGWVCGMKCIKMELGEPDASGRRRPVEIPDSEFTMDVDTVIMSLGTSPNPLISSTTEGLEINKWKCIIAEEENGQTTKAGVYAGGDAVTGAATVILAMGAGKAAAKGIDEYIKSLS
jgi:glutamate synthase (NADPH/NADH) small chain